MSPVDSKAARLVVSLLEGDGQPGLDVPLIKASFRVPMHLGLARRLAELDDGTPGRGGSQKADLYAIVSREPDWEAQTWTYHVTSCLPLPDLTRELNRLTFHQRRAAGVVGIAVQAEGLVDILA